MALSSAPSAPLIEAQPLLTSALALVLVGVALRAARRRVRSEADSEPGVAAGLGLRPSTEEDPRAVPLVVQVKEREEFMARPRKRGGHVLIFSRTWEVDNAGPVILLVHGLNGHGAHDSNVWTAHSLVNRGYTTVAIDAEGHGRSGGTRGQVANIETDIAGDITALLLRTRERYPRRPLFLMGTSFGGLSAALAALAVQQSSPSPLLAGVVLQCPLIKPAKTPPPIVQAVARLLALVAPHLPLLPHAAGAGTKAGAAAAAVRQRMLADKLCYAGRMRIGTGLALQSAAAHLASRLHEMRLPFLLQHGSDDALVAPVGSQQLAAKAASQDKTLLVYDSAGHNLLSEEPATLHKVRSDYLEWLDQRAEASAASASL